MQGKHSIMQWLAEEDAREKKAGLRDARLRGVVQRFIEKFSTKEALTTAFHAADSGQEYLIRHAILVILFF